MKTRIVPAEEITPEKGLLAGNYVRGDILMDDEAFEALQAISRRCYDTAKSKGWWERYEGEAAAAFMPEVISSKLMLMVSELAETLEEVRDGKDPREVYYSTTYKDGGIEYSSAAQEGDPAAKPEGVPIELADTIIRIFDLAEHLGIDVASAVRKKMRFNETRPHKHGGKKI